MQKLPTINIPIKRKIAKKRKEKTRRKKRKKKSLALANEESVIGVLQILIMIRLESPCRLMHRV